MEGRVRGGPFELLQCGTYLKHGVNQESGNFLFFLARVLEIWLNTAAMEPQWRNGRRRRLKISRYFVLYGFESRLWYSLNVSPRASLVDFIGFMQLNVLQGDSWTSTTLAQPAAQQEAATLSCVRRGDLLSGLLSLMPRTAAGKDGLLGFPSMADASMARY